MAKVPKLYVTKLTIKCLKFIIAEQFVGEKQTNLFASFTRDVQD